MAKNHLFVLNHPEEEIFSQMFDEPDSALDSIHTHFYQPCLIHGDTRLNENIIQDFPSNWNIGFLEDYKHLVHCSFPFLRSHQRISPGRRHIYPIRNEVSLYREELLAFRPTPKLEDYPLSAVRDYLFNTFTATFHIGGYSSIRKLRTRHTVVTGTHLSQSDFKSASQASLTFCKALRPTLSFVQR